MKKLKSQGFRQTGNGPVLKEYLHIYVHIKKILPHAAKESTWGVKCCLPSVRKMEEVVV
jgi:hypothetical protein